jgi:DNA-binding CsgD family transcriptional regulator
MAEPSALAQARRRIRELSNNGLESTQLRLAVLDQLARVVPFDAAFFPTADPATLLYTSAVRTGMPDGLTADFLANEFECSDVNKFRSMVGSSTTAATLDSATHGDWSTSTRSRELMQPIGLGDELRVVFGTGSTTWGFACLHRGLGRSFDTDEVALVRSVASDVGEGLRRSAMVQRVLDNTAIDGPGMMTLAADLSVLAATPTAEMWLEDLAATEQPRARPLPVAVQAVVRALSETPQGPSVPRLTVRAASGRWLVLHAATLHCPGSKESVSQIAVVIEPASRVEMEPLIASGFALTRREAETLTLLLRGLPTKTIANALHITTHTANDYVKSIYAKTGVNSRGELMTVVFLNQNRLRAH